MKVAIAIAAALALGAAAGWFLGQRRRPEPAELASLALRVTKLEGEVATLREPKCLSIQTVERFDMLVGGNVGTAKLPRPSPPVTLNVEEKNP
jgi:hypothetical protein